LDADVMARAAAFYLLVKANMELMGFISVTKQLLL
jgi:hypothetical protein